MSGAGPHQLWMCERRVYREAFGEGGVTEAVVFGEEDGGAERWTALRRSRRGGCSKLRPEVMGTRQLYGIVPFQRVEAA